MKNRSVEVAKTRWGAASVLGSEDDLPTSHRVAALVAKIKSRTALPHVGWFSEHREIHVTHSDK